MTSASLVICVVVLASLFAVGSAVSCSAKYECSAVSTDYNYVDCVDHTCECLTANGFIGSATAVDKCRCDSSRSVYWKDSAAYCISYPVCAASEVAEDRTSILMTKTAQVYKNLVYPTATEILAGTVSVADIFSPNTRGRIDPLGTFDSYSTLVEYFYVLASSPSSRITSIDVIDLFGSGDEVFIRANVLFEFWDGVTPSYNLTQSGRYLFDENNLIISTDLIIHNLGLATNPPIAAHASEIESVCGLLTVSPATCPESMDPSGYYTNFTDCVNFLTNDVPFGSFDQSFSNSVVCRLIHTLLTVFDPVVHCPHAGKTGGGKCIDVPYKNYYLVNY